MRSGVSVLIPTYNGAAYLSECIRSVFDQTLPAAEIIVIDDGSEDATPEVAAEWGARIRYHRVPHGGLSYARNHAVSLAETDTIAFLDCDDIWLPRKLELQMAALSSAIGPAMIFGHVQQFVSAELSPDEASRIEYDDTPQPGLIPSTCLIAKVECERTGPFDESIQTGEFIEWFSRARDAGVSPIVVPELVCRRRIHQNNLGRGGSAVHVRYLHTLKKVLDRRRMRN